MIVLDEIYSITFKYSNGEEVTKSNVCLLTLRHMPRRSPIGKQRPILIHITPEPCDKAKEYLHDSLRRALNPSVDSHVVYGDTK